MGGKVVEARRPQWLVVLASVFVLTTFLNGIRISENPLAENPMNVAGVVLGAAFVATRLARARIWRSPACYFWAFCLLAGGVETARLVLGLQGGGMSSLRVFAQHAQAFLLYLIFFDVSGDRRAALSVLTAYLVGAILLSLVANFGPGGAVGTVQVGMRGELLRVGVLGMNLNEQAIIYGIALAGVASRGISIWPRFRVRDWVFTVGAVSMLLALLRTGSRTGLGVMAVGVFAGIGLMFRGRRWASYLFLVPFLLYGLGNAIMSSDLVQTRITEAVEGRVGMRDILAQEASIMVIERPILGWGSQYITELGQRVGKERIAAHNTYLQIMTSFGLVGFVPWALGVGATVWRLWRNRADLQAALFLVLLFALMAAMVPGNLGYSPFAWILLALAGAIPVHKLRRDHVPGPLLPGAFAVAGRRFAHLAEVQRQPQGTAHAP